MGPDFSIISLFFCKSHLIPRCNIELSAFQKLKTYEINNLPQEFYNCEECNPLPTAVSISGSVKRMLEFTQFSVKIHSRSVKIQASKELYENIVIYRTYLSTKKQLLIK